MHHNGRSMALPSSRLAGLVFVLSFSSACSDSDGSEPASGKHDESVKQAPTWYQDVAPLVNAKCVSCHQGGGIGSFSMSTYEAAKPFATLMASAVEEGRMPPFLAVETDTCQ